MKRALLLIALAILAVSSCYGKSASPSRKMLQLPGGSPSTSIKRWTPGYMAMSTADTMSDWMEKKADYKFAKEEERAAAQAIPIQGKTKSKEFSYTNIRLDVEGTADTDGAALAQAANQGPRIADFLAAKMGYKQPSPQILYVPVPVPVPSGGFVSGPSGTTPTPLTGGDEESPFLLDSDNISTTTGTTTPPFTVSSSSTDRSKPKRRRSLLGKNNRGWDAGLLFTEAIKQAENNFNSLERKAHRAIDATQKALAADLYDKNRNDADFFDFWTDQMDDKAQAIQNAAAIVHHAHLESAEETQQRIGEKFGLI